MHKIRNIDKIVTIPNTLQFQAILMHLVAWSAIECGLNSMNFYENSLVFWYDQRKNATCVFWLLSSTIPILKMVPIYFSFALL